MKNKSEEILKQCRSIPKEEGLIDLNSLINNSNSFPIPFPIHTVRLSELRKRKPLEKIMRNIESTYALVHERVLLQMANFLVFKREYGSSVERKLYKDMTVPQFVDRLLFKRAVTFMYPEDFFVLLTGERDTGGWESVGTLQQKPPLLLENCLSYDEMKLSAMLYVSGFTYCINDGKRNNSGVVDEDGVEEEAVIIGLIGARFERPRKMDFEDVLITKDQNTVQNGFGQPDNNTDSWISRWRQMWSEFYDIPSLLYKDLPDIRTDEKKYLTNYVRIDDNTVFSNEVYYKRISVLADTTLLEAEFRAKETGKNAFINVIGCGLGVWRISSHQSDVYILTFIQRIEDFLKKGLIDHVSDINFSYIRVSDDVRGIFQQSSSGTVGRKLIHHEGHPKGGVNIQLENREPSSKLSGEHAGKLLVMTYPWDGNAHPGNEFWIGSLSGSGDPAAACSTQVSELHNAHINTTLRGDTVRVAAEGGVRPLREYCLTHTRQ
ncbi:uncharacterized protein LOC116773412 isoform X2 [Danaus plexippus]|nr:uncharacterized protein LOC116773412 isoform X2 [Danaus plexippus]XP_061384787.1 uncharacterized protein LOC116773412 isoform X2 [Danaus plexippus]